MTDPWPADYGRPALRKSLVGYEQRPAIPGHVQVRARWRFSGVAHYGDAMCNGKPVPLFRTEQNDFTAPWVEMTDYSFAAFKRAWGVA